MCFRFPGGLCGGLIIAAFMGGSAAAQQSTPTTPAPTTPTAPPANNTPRTPTNPTRPTVPTAPSAPTTEPPRIIYITGNVSIADGVDASERIAIERVCAGNQVRFEGWADARGNFSIQLGQTLQRIPDASSTMFVEQSQGFSSPTRVATEGLPDIYRDCELRAKLAGYRSSTIVLAGRRPLDSPNVGTLILYPMSKGPIRAISATSASAPKDAVKAFDKGMKEAEKAKWDKAAEQFEKAVKLHPSYAEAWVQLGRAHLGNHRLEDASKALARASEYDANFPPLYEQLYLLAFEQARWEDLANHTKQLLQLNPYDFPLAYYYNGVAHYQMQHFDDAEASLAEAIKVDKWNENPKTHYVMGLVLVRKKNYQAASERLQVFTQLAPKDSNIDRARQLIAEIAKLQQ